MCAAVQSKKGKDCGHGWTTTTDGKTVRFFWENIVVDAYVVESIN